MVTPLGRWCSAGEVVVAQSWGGGGCAARVEVVAQLGWRWLRSWGGGGCVAEVKEVAQLGWWSHRLGGGGRTAGEVVVAQS